MSADDLVEGVSGSISDGGRVDWDLAQSSASDEEERTTLHALREVERVAAGYRILQSSTTRRGSGGGGPSPGRLGPARWGDLTVLELARAGANGEVWRAWDPWLQREVALKFLLASRAQKVAGVEASDLLAEARALARVRHPGVVAVYGIAEHDGRVGMWMEFLEGGTLAAEIERRGALPSPEVVKIGLELCRALEAIESAGLVHGDIKPANIVLEAGRAVLTDFGLGRRWELTSDAWRASGTPIFMSPGVLSGEAPTPRSDLYSLGVTLRWALTGRAPFQARNFEELEVEAKTGPATRLADERPAAPAALVSAIDRAMAPDPDRRFPGAAQMTAALESAQRSMTARPLRRLARATILAACAFALALGSLAVGRLLGGRTAAVTRFSITAPPRTIFDLDPVNVAVSPDGLLLAFIASDSTGTGRIWLRPLNGLDARSVPGTEGGQGPFWSPDSRHLGFFAEGKLKKVSVNGGLPQIVCAAPDGRGGSWGNDGQIVFAPIPTGPLCRVSADGGAVSVMVSPDSARGENALRWPQFLPDGKRFLYVSLPARDGSYDIFASSLDAPGRQFVLRSDAAPAIAGKDMLVLVRGGSLVAQRFDFGRLRARGNPITLGPTTSSELSVGERLVSASMNGVLAHRSADLPNTQLVWLDRSGRPQGSARAPEGRYEKGVISPDGRQVAVVRRTSPAAVDLWAIDLATSSASRLSTRSQPRIGGAPAWSPDGRHVAFSSNRDGPTNVYVKDLGQAKPEELLYGSNSQFKEVTSWSPDGRYIAFGEANPVTGWDTWFLPLQGMRRPVPFLTTRSYEASSQFSPDGNWVSFTCDELGGTGQIYVQSLSKAGERHRISLAESEWSSWSRDGRELVFISSDQTVWAVPVVTSPSFHAGIPKRLFRYTAEALWIAPTPDFRRFLLAIPAGNAQPSMITVVHNWRREVP